MQTSVNIVQPHLLLTLALLGGPGRHMGGRTALTVQRAGSRLPAPPQPPHAPNAHTTKPS